MRFRKSATPPPFLNSRHQRRLLMLFGLLVLVLIAMRFAAKASTWNWLFVGRQSTPAKSEHRNNAPRLPRQSPLHAGEFRARTAETGGKPSDAGGSQFAFGAKSPAADADSVDLTIPPEFLVKIEDGSYAVALPELDGYYGILARVAKLPQQSLRDAANRGGPAPFSVLLNEAKTYRGQILTIEGKLGSLRPLPDTRKELGLGTLYEAWIVPPESGNNPYRVVFSELPEGLKPQNRYESPPPQVRATGYFFKVQRYEVEENDDQSHRAPLILAKRIQLLNTTAAPSHQLGLAPYVIGFALLLGGVLALTMWRLSAGDKKFTENQLQRFDTAQSADVSDLKRLDASADQADFLRQLSESETPSKP